MIRHCFNHVKCKILCVFLIVLDGKIGAIFGLVLDCRRRDVGSDHGLCFRPLVEIEGDVTIAEIEGDVMIVEIERSVMIEIVGMIRNLVGKRRDGAQGDRAWTLLTYNNILNIKKLLK